ncbi:hypothetical protein [Brazilian marseillevirus]|uniref:hypothetical protein n=1 Tax=Brazilian marseillevirus TaxID=1813599 RepID=UPI000780684A|nr:hypothetical protein A3303_gp428 [Brazilian marseillevirus]AMQ10936.1 hypothetical protein [Brazilian marseillevirus]
MRCVRPLFCLLGLSLTVVYFSFWTTEKKLAENTEAAIHIFLSSVLGCCAISCLTLCLSLSLALEAAEQ